MYHRFALRFSSVTLRLVPRSCQPHLCAHAMPVIPPWSGSLFARSRSICILVLVSSLFLSGCSTLSSSTAQLDDAYADNRDHADELHELITSLDIQWSNGNPGLQGNALPAAERFVSTALSHVGTQYKFGGTSPESGFDCSGLVWFAARKSLGLEMPRSSAEQARFGQSVKRSELRKGDLVFFNTRGRRYSHVGIYIGNDRFVHAPRKGAAVRVESLSSRYWTKRYNGARRFVDQVELASNQ